jgi:uncharacterized repeat protein (TIGR01451 family)
MKAMKWWKRNRAAAGMSGAMVLAIAAWTTFSRTAPAQQEPPARLPESVTDEPVRPGEKLPSLVVPDPDVQPAQFTMPAGPGGYVPGAAPTAARAVPDPPTPVVRIQVRVPADTPPGDDVKYIITVQNASSAEAHGVTVRNPLSESIASVVKADPEPDKPKAPREAGAKDAPARELVWSFGTLAGGKSKTIELTLRPKADATEIRNMAYVRFEHGEVVTTRVNKPAIKVTKSAPKQTVRDEPYSVRIQVENTGKVHAENVRVTENVPVAAEFEAVTKGAKRTVQPEGQQWFWEIARLMPGERKTFEYRITPHDPKDSFTLTSVAAGKGIQERAEARTLVLVPGLNVKIAGPVGVVSPGESAKYEITVRNTGTLPCTNVRVTGTVPSDCKATRKTEGGQIYRDTIQWVVPRLEPEEAHSFRYEIKANTSGQRTVTASATDARGQRTSQELATVFQGTASLVWESVPSPVALSVGKQGTLTLKVRNTGGEPARNVRLEVDLPATVDVVQVAPEVRPAGGKLQFGPEVIPAYGQSTYIITFEARQPSQAWFKLKLGADCLGNRPMQTEKAVEITGGSR